MTIDELKHIILFESCQLTKGVERTLLTDFQRYKIDFLDNQIYDILLKSRIKSISEILAEYSREENEIILEYFRYLIQEEYAFLCDKEEVDFFPSINIEWDHPAYITNCIIDFDTLPIDINLYYKVFIDLDILGCENLQIRVFNNLSLDFLQTILTFLNKTSIYRIELLLKSDYDIDFYQGMLSAFPRINEIVIHSATEDSNIKLENTQVLRTTTKCFTDASCCGVVSPDYFNLRLEHFLESNNYNSCLNRKVCVDKNGFIKNCPSMKANFGVIGEISILDVIKNEHFLKIGSIKKSEIAICNVCEFRHVCTDCRAYHESDDSVKKPIKCGYNPYTMQWSN